MSSGYTRALASTAPVAPAVALPQGPMTGFDCAGIVCGDVVKEKRGREEERKRISVRVSQKPKVKADRDVGKKGGEVRERDSLW